MSSIRCAGISDPGRHRRENEDRWLADRPLGLFLVVDGFGGEAGKWAAQMVVDSLPPLLRRNLRGLSALGTARAQERIQSVVAALNQQVWTEIQKLPHPRQIGAALVFSLIWDRQALIAHVGDSRAYLYRGDLLEQLTRDHSAVERLVDEQKLTPEKAAGFASGGELTRYIGMTGEVTADIRLLDVEPDDVLLLCSDGLSSALEPVEMEKILSLRVAPEKTCRLLVDAANRQGGDDNITAIVIALGLKGQSPP